MAKSLELNKEFKEEINKVFTDLFKEIGNNRQQLVAKVLSQHKELHKELTKNKIDTKRQNEIRAEVSRIVKMAHQQLPHLKAESPKPAVPVKKK